MVTCTKQLIALSRCWESNALGFRFTPDASVHRQGTSIVRWYTRFRMRPPLPEYRDDTGKEDQKESKIVKRKTRYIRGSPLILLISLPLCFVGSLELFAKTVGEQ